jgi:hypothetical protein
MRVASDADSPARVRLLSLSGTSFFSSWWIPSTPFHNAISTATITPHPDPHGEDETSPHAARVFEEALDLLESTERIEPELDLDSCPRFGAFPTAMPGRPTTPARGFDKLATSQRFGMSVGRSRKHFEDLGLAGLFVWGTLGTRRRDGYQLIRLGRIPCGLALGAAVR